MCCSWHMQITCCRKSASPRIRHQQRAVSSVCHLISSRDMIPLCGTLSEWHHTRIGRCQPGPRACGRQRSLPRHAVVSLVTSLVLTKLDYCNSLLVGLPPKLLTTPGRRHQHSSSFGLSCYEGRSHYTCVERPTLATNPGKDPVQAMYPCVQVLT